MRKPILLAWCLTVTFLLTVLWVKRREEAWVGYEDVGMLPPYCGGKPRGFEGVLHRAQPGLVLHAVVMTIRHGDRSSIFTLPNTNQTSRWTCRPAGLEQRRAAAAAKVVSVDGRPLQRSLLPQTEAGGNGFCAPGQLTPRGFGQHTALGRHLGRAFGPLLRSIGADHHSNLSHPRLYVRSTDYARTQMSAAALLYGMLPPSMRHPDKAWYSLHTQEQEQLEWMHGVGLASSSKVKGDGGGEKLRSGSCSRATELAHAQLASWHDDSEAMGALADLFGHEARQMPVTQVADVLYAHACHEMRLPCAERGTGCVTGAMASRFFRLGDDAYCAKYNGLLGGLRASQLAMFPLLKEIVERLQAASSGGGERLVLLSGHDTVIAQLLAALGGMTDARHCRWPPYASRIVFEVWRPVSTSALRHGPQLRVLFNGVVVTHLIPECAQRADGIDATTITQVGVTNLELCPLETFVKGVLGRIPPGSTFEAECRADQGQAL